jgi:hypothetical protein
VCGRAGMLYAFKGVHTAFTGQRERELERGKKSCMLTTYWVRTSSSLVREREMQGERERGRGRESEKEGERERCIMWLLNIAFNNGSFKRNDGCLGTF